VLSINGETYFGDIVIFLLLDVLFPRNKVVKLLVSIIVLVIASFACAAGGIKKWVDEEGNVHFGDVPPVGVVTEKVIVRNKPAVPTYTGRRTEFDDLIDYVRSPRKKRKNTKEQIAGHNTRGYSERLRYRNAVVSGKVLIGMTPQEVRRAWGNPDSINVSQGSYGKSEQWVYITPTDRKYIYFDNGKVTGWN